MMSPPDQPMTASVDYLTPWQHVITFLHLLTTAPWQAMITTTVLCDQLLIKLVSAVLCCSVVSIGHMHLCIYNYTLHTKKKSEFWHRHYSLLLHSCSNIHVQLKLHPRMLQIHTGFRYRIRWHRHWFVSCCVPDANNRVENKEQYTHAHA
jgi:hypothetical protein